MGENARAEEAADVRGLRKHPKPTGNSFTLGYSGPLALPLPIFALTVQGLFPHLFIGIIRFIPSVCHEAHKRHCTSQVPNPKKLNSDRGGLRDGRERNKARRTI